MAERFRLNTAGSTVVTPSPGVGSSGFSSRVMVWGDANGALFNNGTGPVWDSTLNSMGIGTTAPSSASLMIVPGFDGSTVRRGIIVRRSTGLEGDAFQVESTTPGVVASITGIGRIRGADGTSAGVGLGFQSEAKTGLCRDGGGRMVFYTSGNPIITIESSGTTNRLGFFSTRAAARNSSFTVSSTAVFTTADRSLVSTVAKTTLSTLAFTGALADRVMALTSCMFEVQTVLANLMRQLGASSTGGSTVIGYGLVI